MRKKKQKTQPPEQHVEENNIHEQNNPKNITVRKQNKQNNQYTIDNTPRENNNENYPPIPEQKKDNYVRI